jgi:hypothetical protein
LASPGLPTDPFLAGHTCKNAPSPAVGHRFQPQNHPPKIDAKLVKKDNSNSIKIGCTMLDGAFLRNGCNQQKIAARQFGELFL